MQPAALERCYTALTSASSSGALFYGNARARVFPGAHAHLLPSRRARAFSFFFLSFFFCILAHGLGVVMYARAWDGKKSRGFNNACI